MWTTLNFKGRMKKWAGDICKGTIVIECQRNWSLGLGTTLGDRQKIKNYFYSFRNFSKKSVILLEPFFEKIELKIFFLWGRGKTKKAAWDICKRTSDIEFERDRAIGLGSTFGSYHIDTHTQTFFFSKTLFLQCGSDTKLKFIKNWSQIFWRLQNFLHSLYHKNKMSEKLVI